MKDYWLKLVKLNGYTSNFPLRMQKCGVFFRHSVILCSELPTQLDCLEIAYSLENGKLRKHPSHQESMGSWYRNLFMKDLVPRFSMRKFGDFPFNSPHSESFLQWPQCHLWGWSNLFKTIQNLLSPLWGKITSILLRKRWQHSRVVRLPLLQYIY